jgi:hypothetical protein
VDASDVRTDDEWARWADRGSVHIPMDQLMQRMDELDDRVVCVCAVGARSAGCAQFLNCPRREAVNLTAALRWRRAGSRRADRFERSAAMSSFTAVGICAGVSVRN